MLPEIEAAYHTVKAHVSQYRFLKSFYKHITPLSVLNAISREVQAIKEEDNIILISEFNTIVSDHIKTQPAPFIYERIGEKFRHYFIDEFQDTSVMQWENLLPLMENTLSAENTGVMIVGDAKQSIYRWRGGKPEQFIALCKGNTELPLSPQLKRLEANYRSLQEIVSFNNRFFKYLSTIIFSNDTYQSLYEQSSQQIIHDEGGYVHVNFLNGNAIEDKDTAYAEETLKAITSSLQDGFEPRDICVLVRKKREGVAVANYLNEHSDLDIISSETLLLAHAPEILFITNLLKLILEPDNKEVPLRC